MGGPGAAHHRPDHVPHLLRDAAHGPGGRLRRQAAEQGDDRRGQASVRARQAAHDAGRALHQADLHRGPVRLARPRFLVQHPLGAEADHLQPPLGDGPARARRGRRVAAARDPDRRPVRPPPPFAVRPAGDGLRADRRLGAGVLPGAGLPVRLLVQVAAGAE